MSRRKPKSKKGRRRGAGTFLLLVLVLLAGAGGAAWLVEMPFGPEAETFVEIAPGSSTVHIGRQLEEVGIIRSRYAFDLLRWIQRGRLKAGEYRFDHPAPAWEVYARIARGDVYTRTVVVPEGANVFDIEARLQKAGLKAGQNFVEEQGKETSLIADLDPNAKSLEGYLFPDTYRFQRSATPAQVCAAMVRRFREAAAEIGLKENVHQVVTIASLVEKETAINAERPLVASVFNNRLAENMPLMTDPAVIYGLELEGKWRGTIYQSDLKRDTPYNTYLHTGLPPGPVANPGLPSLKAAMSPAHTNYLYFVASGANPQGKSLFASTLEEHARNVSGYRKAMKKAGVR
ncbi:MAG TPA: endolytic transglycosylase MltG [Terracidiphilus sp.]|nr:endolytic transglycosylase MltG [Terracidiphilus sp.]